MNHNEDFPPDTVDEQVDRFTSVSSHELLPRGAEVISRLSALYQADQRSTERVWKRLAQHLAEHDTDVQSASDELEAVTVPERGTERKQSMQPISRLSRQTRSSRLALIAAVLFAALLVGSLLWVFHLAQSTRTGHSNVQPTTSLPTSSVGVYFSRIDGVYRVDARTGKVLWHTHIADHPVQNPTAGLPVVIGDTLYIAPDAGNVLSALNTQNGKLRWSHTFNTGVDNISMDDGRLYINSSLGSSIIYVVNPANGALIATYKSGHAYWNNPVVVHTILYYTEGESIYAVQLPGQKLLWQQKIGNKVMLGRLTVQNGIVYTDVLLEGTPHYDGVIDAFDAHSGKKLWQSPAIAGSIRSFIVTNEMIYIGAVRSELLAFDVHTHKLAWQKPFDIFDMRVASGTLYLDYDLSDTGGPANSGFIAVNAATGKLLWQKNNSSNGGGGGVALAGVLNGIVYGDGWTNDGQKGTLYALNSSNGTPIWTIQIGPYLQWGGVVVA